MTTLPESPTTPDQPHNGRVLCGLRSLADVIAGLGGSSAGIDALSDDAVLEGQALVAGARRALDTQAVWFAATLARRSRPELGGQGLAARQGFRSPEDLLQNVSGSTKGDAIKLLAIGRLLAETDAAEKAARDALEAQRRLDAQQESEPTLDGATHVELPVPAAAVPPWHAPITRALKDGWLSLEKADSVRKGLGDLDTAITPEKLATALVRLLEEARTLNADQLFKRARRVRDVLDEAGIAAREKKAYEDRSFRIWHLPGGKVRLSGLFAPEDGEYLLSVYDAITSPRRGGVRFVDKEQAAWAKTIQDDPRSTEQLAADAFLAVIKLGVSADPKRIFGGKQPAVRLVTIRPAGTTPSEVPSLGSGVIEGATAGVSAETIERNLCDSGLLEITFDDTGHGIDLGREQRTFSTAQRAALAIRDGGCRWPGCDRPPSWTETHHIEHWKDDEGPTNLDQGILLCRADHLRLHNDHWRITRDITGRYWLTPPAGLDPDQKPILLTSANAILYDTD